MPGGRNKINGSWSPDRFWWKLEYDPFTKNRTPKSYINTEYKEWDTPLDESTRPGVRPAFGGSWTSLLFYYLLHFVIVNAGVVLSLWESLLFRLMLSLELRPGKTFGVDYPTPYIQWTARWVCPLACEFVLAQKLLRFVMTTSYGFTDL